MEATESTSLLPSSPPSQDGSPSSNRPQLRSHSRGESFVPEFILTSVEKVEDFAHDVTEHVEEMAHDLTTFEIFNLEEHLPEGMDHVPPEYDPLSNELVTDLEDLAEAPDLELIEEIIHPPDPMAASAEKLGVLPLAIMVFYSVSGGPFGCETSVRAGGNFFALLGFLVMPFVWSLQEALMTAELGTVFPEASGGVAWVEEAFGTNMGWMTGYLGWIAGATVCLLLCRHVACSGVNLRRGCLIPRCFIFSHTLTSSVLGQCHLPSSIPGLSAASGRWRRRNHSLGDTIRSLVDNEHCVGIHQLAGLACGGKVVFVHLPGRYEPLHHSHCRWSLQSQTITLV